MRSARRAPFASMDRLKCLVSRGKMVVTPRCVATLDCGHFLQFIRSIGERRTKPIDAHQKVPALGDIQSIRHVAAKFT